MSTSEDRPLDPASIASASFATSRRGFDPTEVRAYLQRLAADTQALAEREAAARRELDALRAAPAQQAQLDDATVAAWLGEEAARVLTTAREAAAQLRAKAEDEAARLREDTRAEAERTKFEAIADAAQIREEVAAEEVQRRQAALAEAEAEIEAARQEGRSMVSEARAVRERMLADLSRRRDGARAQLAALRGERDRIVNAIEATRDHLDRLMDDLRAASPEDDRELPPIPYEDVRGVTPGEPRLTLVRPLHPVHQEPEVEDVLLDEPTSPSVLDVGVLVEGPTDLAEGEAEAEDTVTEVADEDRAFAPVLVLGEAEATGETTGEPPAPSTAEGEEAEGAEDAADAAPAAEVVDDGPGLPEPAEEVPDGSDDLSGSIDVSPLGAGSDHPFGTDLVGDDTVHVAPPSEPEPPAEPTGPLIDLDAPVAPVDTLPKGLVDEITGLLQDDRAPTPPGAAANEAEGAKPSVDDVFARIRAARSDAVSDAPGETSATSMPADELGESEPSDAAEAEPLDPDAALVAARDAEVEPHRAALARQLKRALADEQNEVFDRLRRLSKVTAADEVLGAEAAHAERYRAAGEDAVWAAAMAGARSMADDDTLAAGGLEAALERHRVLDDVLDEISIEVAIPVRERLEDALDAASGDPEEATALLRNAYREWKSQRLDDLAEELVLSAYGRGAFAATPPGTEIRWVVDVAAPACDDAAANAAAGGRACGDAFPTGHLHPPAHVGCRCLLASTHG